MIKYFAECDRRCQYGHPAEESTTEREKFNEYANLDEKKEHYEAEKQLIMVAMPPMLVGQYNEIVL